jgi:hypothetical protein
VLWFFQLKESYVTLYSFGPKHEYEIGSRDGNRIHHTFRMRYERTQRPLACLCYINYMCEVLPHCDKLVGTKDVGDTIVAPHTQKVIELLD